MTMGQRIAEQRKRMGLSQEAMGERLEVSRQAVSKWEADGTVPEIDKLIAMSKLFGVSVGWLLGVEEQNTGKQDSLSEEQIKIIEGLVEKYQTPPQPEKKPHRLSVILSIFASILALILAWVAIDRVTAFNDRYDGQLDNLFYNYANLESQLNEVSGQLDELVQADKLLTDYSFSAEGKTDLSGALVEFTGTPRQWQTGDAAYISARFDGREVAQAECLWDGSGCVARLELPPKDGYSYYYILSHADGVQEQQHLADAYHWAVFVAEGLTLSGFVDLATAYDQETLILINSFAELNAPPLLQQKEASVNWVEASAVIYKNGTEICRQDILSGVDDNEQTYDGGAYLNSLLFWEGTAIPMSDGDRVTARIIAKTDSGICVDQQVYACDRNGDRFDEEFTSNLYL